jgi:hypothetical protein
MYTSIRGWLEIDFKQRAAAEAIIERHRDDLYSGGWAFPAAPFNWTLYLFYGGDIRQGEVPWLREQLEELAALPPVDDDNDMPAGLFVLTAEGHEGADTWHIRDGRLHELPAPDLAWLDR